MLFLLILLTSTIQSTLTTEDDLYEFFKDVLKLAFRWKLCLNYLGNNIYIEGALMSLGITMLQFNSTYMNHHENLCRIDSYIVSLENIDALYNEETPVKPHSRVLVYTTGSLERQGLAKIVTLSAIDIIIIEGIPTYSPFDFHPVNIKVFSVKLNATIASFREGVSNINSTSFRYIKWAPKFNNGKFRIAVLNAPPFIFHNTSWGLYDGIDLYLLRFITEEIYQWPVVYVPYKELSWAETLQEVKRNKCDLAVGGQYEMHIRDVGLDSTYPYQQVCGNYLAPKAAFLPGTTFVFQAIQLNAWLLLLALMFILSIILKLFSYYYYRFRKDVSWRYADYLFMVFRIIASQGLQHFPNKNGLKILIFCWVYYSILFNCMYTAGFTSRLTFPRFIKSMETFQDLLENEMDCFDSGEYTTSLLRKSQNKYLRRLAELTETNNSLHDLPASFCIYANVVNGRHIFPETDAWDYDRWDMKVMPMCHTNFYISFGLSKNSPFTKIFNHWIKWSLEYGFVTAWFRHVMNKPYSIAKYMSNFYIRAQNYGDIKIPIMINEFQGALYFLMFGYSMSLLVFFIEMLQYHSVVHDPL